METSLKPGFVQIFSCCPKNLSCSKFLGGGGLQAPSPPGTYAYGYSLNLKHIKLVIVHTTAAPALYIVGQ